MLMTMLSGPSGEELFRRLVVGVFLDVPHVGRHEEKVTRSGLYPLLEVLAVMDPDVAGYHVCGGSRPLRAGEAGPL